VKRFRALFLLVVASCATTSTSTTPNTGQPQAVHLAPNAPEDRPGAVSGKGALARWQGAVAPYSNRAKATYPDAKRRYLAGLPAQQTFFVTTLLRDQKGHFEYIFVVVQRIAHDNVTGQVASQTNLVRTYREGDTISFPETEVIDWMISRPDGSEEGNLVGKFLDTQSQGATTGEETVHGAHRRKPR